MTGVLFGALAGCTQESASGSLQKDDASSSTVTPRDGGSAQLVDAAAPAVCNSLTLDGVATATIEAVTDQAPAPAGGTLEDGTYVLVKAVVYGATEAVAPSPFSKEKLVVEGDSVQKVSLNGTETSDSTTETFTMNGSALTIATTCPKADDERTATYSVTTQGGKTQLAVYYGDATEGIIATIYTKQ